jgi:WhiB family transcriptional regulator, redox-sensing transcriptional regulator
VNAHTSASPARGHGPAGLAPVYADRRSVMTLLRLGDGEPAWWRGRALCAQTDPDEFFPELGGSGRAAKRICARCEVRAECRDDALATNERFGVWGGMTPQERRAYQRLPPAQRARFATAVLARLLDADDEPTAADDDDDDEQIITLAVTP